MLFNSAEIREVLRTMRRNNANPVEDDKYIAFVHPDTWSDLLSDTDFKSFGQHAQPRDTTNVLSHANTVDYLGIRFVMTSRATIHASLGLSGADVYSTVVVGDQAYGVSELETQNLRIYFKPRGSGGTGDPIDQISTLGKVIVVILVAQLKPVKFRESPYRGIILSQGQLYGWQGATTRRQGLGLLN